MSIFPSSKASLLLAVALASITAGVGAYAASVDHSIFPPLQGPFTTGPDVTKACLTCHTEAAKQVHKSIHWTWNFASPSGQKLGKRNVINNFCVALESNEPRCTSCHVGYGWKDNTFDFTAEANVDCLVCHEQTGTYKKFPTDAGHPNYVPKQFPPGRAWPVANLAKAAQSVKLPTRDNCGVCHFFGGGGDAVKHGDIDSSLSKPSRDLDVHMAQDGLNFSCATCHVTKSHLTSGSRFASKGTYSKGDAPAASCETCHGETPHKSAQAPVINKHAEKLACPTCHVPEFARAKPTKMLWDWSTAGQLREDKPFVTRNAVAFGMKEAGLPFSGKVGFVESVYYWPITHMVAPKQKALACAQCHSANGRLRDVPGLRIPVFQ